jgi:hypothetical protein
MGWPPMSATAASVETRVRVERLENVSATVLPRSEFWMEGGVCPDLTAFLWDEALRIRVVSSWGVRSAIERRCRGAKGEVWGVPDSEDEYSRTVDEVRLRVRRHLFDGRKRRAVAISR